MATPRGPTRKDGWEIDIAGDIVHLVAFSNSAKGRYDKAVLAGRTACSVKVVAGAGFDWSRLAVVEGLLPCYPVG